MTRKKKQAKTWNSRSWIVLCFMLSVLTAFLGKAVWLQLDPTDKLRKEAADRHVRHIVTPSKRGMILDRRGEPLAVSTPLDSVVMDTPQVTRYLAKHEDRLASLAAALNVEPVALKKRIVSNLKDRHVYLAKYLEPARAKLIKDVGVTGVSLERQYRRFYPESWSAASVIGMTDAKDSGVEGLEAQFNDLLTGHDGQQRVFTDRDNAVLEYAGTLRHVRNGDDLRITIDRRIQSIAYDALAAQVAAHKAKGGAAIVVDVRSGEVLAVVNEPTSNPNSRSGPVPRNRVFTDAIEPGSVMKTFAVVGALQAGLVSPNTVINTSPGVVKVGKYLVKDHHDYGELTTAGVIAKSSNVGVNHIALKMSAEQQINVVRDFGFFQDSGLGFPGEKQGSYEATRWGDVQRSALSRGYGVSATLVQLARAYAILANDGVRVPLTLIERQNSVTGTRVIDSDVAQTAAAMLELVVTDGTGKGAATSMYRVAGKTGTARKNVGGQYKDKLYQSAFAGFAPASNPRLAMVVMIDEPSAGEYYGGLVAGPVFSRTISAALRIMNVAPDKLVDKTGSLIAKVEARQ